MTETIQSDPAETLRAPVLPADFYKGRPSFAARVDSLPFTEQEHDIIKQLHGLLKIFDPLIIVGDEGCGKTTAALMLARHMLAAGEIGATYWYDSDHVSSCLLPRKTTSSLLVIDDFLGHCPSESLMRWKNVRQFFSSTFVTSEKNISIVMTSRTSVLQQIQASCGADFSSVFCETQVITMSVDYRQMWKNTTTGMQLEPPDFDRLPSVGFPLCCKLLPYVSQSVQKILFQQPRFALREAVVERMNITSVARTALALLAVTDGYLDTSVLMDPEKLQTSRYWKPLNSLEKQPVDKNIASAVMSFYEGWRGLVVLEDEFVSFPTEAVRESVLVVLCESHAEFLSEFCSLKLLSQIALVTSDVKDDSDRAEKPVLPDCAKSAFLRRMITELESRNYHGVFTCSLLTHASFQQTLAQKINQDLMGRLLDTRDPGDLPFLFYAGAIDSVFKHALSLLHKTNERMGLKALLACCFWDHGDQIDRFWIQDRRSLTWSLTYSLKTATIKQIVTGQLPGVSRETAPLWSKVPISPDDTLLTMAAAKGNDAVVQKLASKGMTLGSQGNNGLTALMHYCARGNSNMTSFLLREGADPLTADITGTTALMFALNRKEWDIPQKLVNLENCQMVNGVDESPLMFACANGWNVRMINKILSQGAKVTSKDASGLNCFHYACLYGHAEVAANLLQKTNIDAEEKTDDGLTPVLLALASPHGSQLMELLLKAQPPKKSDLPAIVSFVCKYSGRRSLEQIFSAYVLEEGVKLFALKEACAFGNADIVRYLLDQGISPKVFVNEKLSTWLHLACSGISLETVETLATEVDCNVKTASGTTPIMIALQHGRLEFVQLLHNRGASLNVKDDIGGCLHHAVLSDSVRVLEWCVNELHMDVNDRNGDSQTPLFLATSEGRTRSMKWLLDHQADVTATDKDGNSCLHAAAQSGCLRALEILRSERSPAELKVLNNNGKTPLQLARESGHIHVVTYLRDFGLVDSESDMDSVQPS